MQENPMRLGNKVTIVTGAGSGFGSGRAGDYVARA
jgi:NADP-dependent 3-hydroxy acid dehydrogenase YdfG